MNQLSTATGLGVIHGLLVAEDLSELCEEFLEIGVDPETRCVLQVSLVSSFNLGLHPQKVFWNFQVISAVSCYTPEHRRL
jgi:hypothetical protein